MPKPVEGRTYLYHGSEVKIQSVTMKEKDLYLIETDKRTIRVNASDFKDFLPVEVPLSAKNNTALILALKEENQPMNDLATKLNAMIDKIETGSLTVDRAKAMNETARNIISIGKARIEVLKAMKG